MAAPFRGFLTSHNGSSVNFLGDGTIFWGDGTRIQAFSGGSRRVSRAIPLERGSTRHTTTWRGFRKRSRRDGKGVRNLAKPKSAFKDRAVAITRNGRYEINLPVFDKEDVRALQVLRLGA